MQEDRAAVFYRERVKEFERASRSVTGETALRLARYFKTTPQYWMNLQARYDLESARNEWETRVTDEVRPRDAA